MACPSPLSDCCNSGPSSYLSDGGIAVSPSLSIEKTDGGRTCYTRILEPLHARPCDVGQGKRPQPNRIWSSTPLSMRRLAPTAEINPTACRQSSRKGFSHQRLCHFL